MESGQSMTVVTLRPDGDDASFGTPTLVPGGPAYAILNDDDDATYIDLDAGDQVDLTLADLSLPAGAVIKSVRTDVRSSTAGPAVLTATVRDIDLTVVAGGAQTINSPAPLRYTFATYPSGPFSDAQVDSAIMRLSNQGSANFVRCYEGYFVVTYVMQPGLTVNEPTGTLTDTNMPTIQWTGALDSDGGGQYAIGVRIFTAAQYGIGGFDPSTSPATYSSGEQIQEQQAYDLPVSLADGVYRAYVVIWQNVNGAPHLSDWEFTDFEIDVALPGVPTLTLTPENSAGRIKIEFADNPGDAGTDALDLERSYDGGETWLPVRNLAGLSTRISDDEFELIFATEAPIYDYEAPNGLPAAYRCRTLHDYGGGSFAASDWTMETTTWAAEQWWLKDPLFPALNVPITLRVYGDITRAARRGEFQGMGAALPVVVSDSRAGTKGETKLWAPETADRDVLDAILDSSRVLFLQGPTADGEPDRYVSVGDVTTVRFIDNAAFERREFTLPWTEVVQPGSAQATVQYTSGDEEELILL